LVILEPENNSLFPQYLMKAKLWGNINREAYGLLYMT